MWDVRAQSTRLVYCMGAARSILDPAFLLRVLICIVHFLSALL
jgi:hypothetical protein